MKFSHLHVHTEYSLLDGSNKIKEYVARVKELGMDSAAITDHGVMYGVIDFYRAAKRGGDQSRSWAVRFMWHRVPVLTGKSGSGDDRYYHLVLLAENNHRIQQSDEDRIQRLCGRLLLQATSGYGTFWKHYHEGIIALSACLAGEVQALSGAGHV